MTPFQALYGHVPSNLLTYTSSSTQIATIDQEKLTSGSMLQGW